MIKGFWEAWTLAWFMWAVIFAAIAFFGEQYLWAAFQCLWAIIYAVVFFFVYKNRMAKEFKEKYDVR